MSDYTCSIDGCASPRLARGWCKKHYYRWYRTGSLGITMGGPPQEVLSRQTRTEGTCLVWVGALNSTGYGVVTYNNASLLAHRWSWELVNGAIPEGMMLDHKCHNTACVNVAHLRLATRHQNNIHLNGPNSRSRTGVRGVKHGKNGKYLAAVSQNGVRFHLGTFDSVEDAEAVVVAKRLELAGEFAGHSRRN